MIMKCVKCNKIKGSSEFYANDRSCKECRKALANSNRAANLEYYQEYDRLRGQLPHRKKLVKKLYKEKYHKPEYSKPRSMKWKEKHPEKRKVHIIIGNAIRDGKIARGPCERCGKLKGVHAHHEDYSKPLEVTWLCEEHHGERHREINEDRRQ